MLELGAGTGRITIPIVEAGVRVTALDLDDGMLERLRQKASTLAADVRGRITTSRADMRSFVLDERFALVIIPFRAFLHNQTRDDQLAALRCAHHHLRPGGELALNVFHPSLEFMAANAGTLAGVWRWRSTQTFPDGGFVVRSDASRYDTVRQRVESMMRIEHFDRDGSCRRTSMLHLELAYLYPSDIASLLADSGFELVRMSGDFAGRPFERDGDELVVEARKL